MELKFKKNLFYIRGFPEFKSHLYGIEMGGSLEQGKEEFHV